MSSEIASALIAGIVSILGLIVTLFISIRNIKVETEKLRIERERLNKDRTEADIQVILLKAELAKLNTETKHNSALWEIEIEKLKAETEKSILEAQQIRNSAVIAEHKQISELLTYFDRPSLRAHLVNSDSFRQIEVMRDIRIKLQMSGICLSRDPIVSKHFEQARDILLDTELNIIARFPAIIDWISEAKTKTQSLDERRKFIGNKVGEMGYKYIEDTISNGLEQIEKQIESLKERLHELGESIEPNAHVFFPI